MCRNKLFPSRKSISSGLEENVFLNRRWKQGQPGIMRWLMRRAMPAVQIRDKRWRTRWVTAKGRGLYNLHWAEMHKTKHPHSKRSRTVDDTAKMQRHSIMFYYIINGRRTINNSLSFHQSINVINLRRKNSHQFSNDEKMNAFYFSVHLVRISSLS